MLVRTTYVHPTDTALQACPAVEAPPDDAAPPDDLHQQLQRARIFPVTLTLRLIQVTSLGSILARLYIPVTHTLRLVRPSAAVLHVSTP